MGKKCCSSIGHRVGSCGTLILGQKVNAAGEGKITGTVKLDGPAPHMKGIDMSKDPYSVKAHAVPRSPGNLGGRSGGGVENVSYLRGLSRIRPLETPNRSTIRKTACISLTF